MLAFGRLIIPERDVTPHHVIHFRILHHLNFSGLSKDRIVKLCAQVAMAREVSVLR